jgi:hypothetical protein
MIQDLDMRTIVHIIPNTNKIYIDYRMFKQYANPSNYEILIDEFVSTINKVKETHDMYEIHVNLSNFTSKAMAHYYPFSQLLFNTQACDMNDVICLVAYNVSVLVSSISQLFVKYIGAEFKNRLILHERDTSPQLLDVLLVNNFFV